MGTELGITPVIIRGEELKQKGFGGTVSVQFSCLLTVLFSKSLENIFKQYIIYTYSGLKINHLCVCLWKAKLFYSTAPFGACITL